MEKIIEDIKTIKPNLKKSSINTYITQLTKLNGGELKDLSFLKDTKKVMKGLNEKPLTTKRNYLTAIMVGTKSQDYEEYEFYRKEVQKLNEEYNEFIEQHKKTPIQNKNWTTLEELKKIQKDMRKNIMKLGLYEKEDLNGYERKLFTDFLICSLYTLIPPVRLDYATMKIIKNIKDNDGKQNFLWISNEKRKHFIFNDFKNVATRGSATFLIPTNLNKIINKYLEFNKTENFIIDGKGNPMTTNAFGKLITRIFTHGDKKPSLNIIRHAWASANVDLKKRKQQAELADKMLHTPALQVAYAKVD